MGKDEISEEAAEKNDVERTDGDSVDVADGAAGIEQIKDFLQSVPQDTPVGDLVDKLESPETQAVIRVRKGMTSEHYSGPLPPPQLLHGFEQVCEGAANRVIAIAEKEQSHRQLMESTALNGAIKKDKRGQDYALLICLIVLIGSMVLIGLDKQISGTLLSMSSLTGLAYIFITGRKEEDNDEPNQPPQEND